MVHTLSVSLALLGTLVVTGVPVLARATGWAVEAPERLTASERLVLRAAIAELPRVDATVSVVQTATLPPTLAARVQHLEAFVVPGHRVVYVLRHHSLRRAAAGARFFIFVLAGVLWHELAHLRGADETHAYAEETRLWTRFIRDQRVDAHEGLRYRADLAAAAQRARAGR